MHALSKSDFLNQNLKEMWFKFNVNIIYFLLLLLMACNTSTEQVKKFVPKKESAVTSTFNQKKIDSFVNQLSKEYKIHKDTLPNYILKNCSYNFFSGFSLFSKNGTNNIQFQFFGFNESGVCNAAQQKLLNNLGDLSQIKPGKNERYIKSVPWFVIKNKHNLIIMKYSCENNLSVEKLYLLKKQLQLQFANTTSEVLNVECGGPLNWL